MNRLDGKIAIITGAAKGLGEADARLFIAEGATVILTDIDDEAGEKIAAELGPKAEYHHHDVCDEARWKELIDDVVERHGGLHVLVNNAGVVNTSYHETGEGIENTFAVNHLGYFLFTNLLLQKLKGDDETRIVNVSSAAHSFVKEMQWEDINYKNNFGQGLRSYGQSKLANLLFTRYLAIKLSTDNISVNAIHPGGVNTSLGSQNKAWYSKPLRLILKPFFRSPLKGAESIIYLATKQDDGVTGEYFVDSKIHKSSAYSKNLEEAHKLWDLSEKLVSQTFNI